MSSITSSFNLRKRTIRNIDEINNDMKVAQDQVNHNYLSVKEHQKKDYNEPPEEFKKFHKKTKSSVFANIRSSQFSSIKISELQSMNEYQLSDIFQFFDEDLSRSLNREEFLAMCMRMGLSMVDYEELFNKIDFNGDSEITYQEWIDYFLKSKSNLHNNQKENSYNFESKVETNNDIQTKSNLSLDYIKNGNINNNKHMNLKNDKYDGENININEQLNTQSNNHLKVKQVNYNKSKSVDFDDQSDTSLTKISSPIENDIKNDYYLPNINQNNSNVENILKDYDIEISDRKENMDEIDKFLQEIKIDDNENDDQPETIKKKNTNVRNLKRFLSDKIKDEDEQTSSFEKYVGKIYRRSPSIDKKKSRLVNYTKNYNF